MTRSATLGRLRYWGACIRGKNVLVRRTDRFEALLVALVVMVAALAVPYAVNVRSSCHAASIRTIDEQIATRHSVDALAVADSETNTNRYMTATTVQAQWVDQMTIHQDTVRTPKHLKRGDHFTVWLDKSGKITTPPGDKSKAGPDAVTAAFVVWLAIVGLCAAGVALACAGLDRIRDRKWDRALRSLAGHDDGWADHRR